MGFRLSSFLAGAGEGAIEIDTAVRDRNFDIIDRSLARREERLGESLSERREKQKQYEQLSALMDNYDLSDDQKYQVLKAGPEVAAKWLDTIPEIAAKKGRSVSDYIVMSDNEASGFTLSKALEEGRLPGMAVELEEFAPTGLRAGVFRSDYGEQATALAESQDREMGYDPTEQSDMDVPEGKIDLMAMYSPDPVDVDSFSAKQTEDYIQEQIARKLNVDYTYDQNGNLRLTDENEEANKLALELGFLAYDQYYSSLANGEFDARNQQMPAIQSAIASVLPSPPPADPDAGDGAETVATEIKPEDLTMETATSPFELAQAIRNDAAKRGEVLSEDEVKAMVKEELERRKAESR
jgi:hypothetical protein